MTKSLNVILFSASLVAMNAQALDISAKPVPKDIVEFTCHDFEEKSKDCLPYICQAPYRLEPTIATRWEIIEKQNNRCIISDTTNDIGLKDYNGNPVPVTRTCEYNEQGVDDLNAQLEDIEAGFFRTSVGSQDDGAYHCTFTSNGKPIESKDYKKSSRDDVSL